MNLKTVMVVAGDPSGDAIAADLVRALKWARPGARFIGAGGPRMAEAGAEISFDLTADAVIGVSDPLKKLPRFLRHKRELARLAAREKPEAVILVDFSFFNHSLARAIRKLDTANWKPRIVKYVSPQVWASRPGRADKMARVFDLLLCLFPFEKDWYAKRVPGFRVEVAGHPMFDRHTVAARKETTPPTVVLLPGSRRSELKRHLPVMLEAGRRMAAEIPVRFTLVASNEKMGDWIRSSLGYLALQVEVQVGGLAKALSEATLAIASTGTVTLECAYYGVPAVTLYKTSALTYFIGRRIATVDYLSMPNILAGEPLYAEFIQHEATGENLANAAIRLLRDPARRAEVQRKLAAIIAELGGPGAAARAAAAILSLP